MRVMHSSHVSLWLCRFMSWVLPESDTDESTLQPCTRALQKSLAREPVSVLDNESVATCHSDYAGSRHEFCLNLTHLNAPYSLAREPCKIAGMGAA